MPSILILFSAKFPLPYQFKNRIAYKLTNYSVIKNLMKVTHYFDVWNIFLNIAVDKGTEEGDYVDELSQILPKSCFISQARDLLSDLLALLLGLKHQVLLYIDLRPGQTCHSKVMHRKEVTHSDCSYGKKSRRRAWLTIWDKVKSHGTVIDWCTGREWPVNCKTVISAWWRSNMPFQIYWVGDWTII